MLLQRAKLADVDILMDIYDKARAIMRRSGNTEQWPVGYPSRALTVASVKEGKTYVALGDDGLIHGTFYLSWGPDPTYATIVDGRWKKDDDYVVIHRIAQDGSLHGLLEEAVGFASSICPYIRIDTHRDNVIMRHILSKLGFEESGTIFTETGSPRLAFEFCGEAGRSCSHGLESGG